MIETPILTPEQIATEQLQHLLQDIPPADFTAHTIPKRHSDGYRTVLNAAPKLRAWLSSVASALEVLLPMHSAATCCTGGGIFVNARHHAGARTLVKLDIANFFPSITRAQLRHVLGTFTSDVTETVVDRCCAGGSYLAQGLPTSTLLANTVCYDLDVGLTRLGWRYTRFVDDITFSSVIVDPQAVSLGQRVVKLFRAYGFRDNETKHCHAIAGVAQQMRVTGLNVDPCPGRPAVRAPRALWRRLRLWTHQAEQGRLDDKALHKACGLAAFLGQTDPERVRPYKETLQKIARPSLIIDKLPAGY